MNKITTKNVDWIRSCQRRSDGSIYAFTVVASYFGRTGMRSVLKEDPDVSDIVVFWRRASDGVRLRFQYRGESLAVLEPYNDSGDYWIGPEDDRDSHDLSDLFSRFENRVPDD